MKHILINNLRFRVLAIVLPILAASCSVIYDDDLRPCRNNVKVRFVYDLNMDFRDLFSENVRSVDVWAFDCDGSLAWHGSREGESLSGTDFFLPADVAPGKYDFVSWCGLGDNNGYELNNYLPATKEELYMMLTTTLEGNRHVSSSPLPLIFNGNLSSVMVEGASTTDIEQEITISLVEDTKNISVSLSGPTVGSPEEFSIFITDNNRRLGYDNIPSEAVTYRHWTYGTNTHGSGVYYKIATSRLMADSNAHLVVVDNSDNRQIIDIRLVDYLLKIKDNYSMKMDDQEFLDRENNYSLQLTLDNNGSFDFNSIIYINGWVVVPTQVENPQ